MRYVPALIGVNVTSTVFVPAGTSIVPPVDLGAFLRRERLPRRNSSGAEKVWPPVARFSQMQRVGIVFRC
jgi:hypothetical protein